MEGQVRRRKGGGENRWSTVMKVEEEREYEMGSGETISKLLCIGGGAGRMRIEDESGERCKA